MSSAFKYGLFAALAVVAFSAPAAAADAARPTIDHGTNWRAAVQRFAKDGNCKLQTVNCKLKTVAYVPGDT